MSLKVILFDLDGTLLTMDDNSFEDQYFYGLSQVLKRQKYNAEELKNAILQGVENIMKNDGKISNEEAFWNTMSNVFGEKILKEKSRFDKFYNKPFLKVLKNTCKPIAIVPAMISSLKSMGYRIVLATNPLFPAVGTLARLKFAGLDPDMFELISTYEHFSHAKPNPKYYQDILKMIGAKTSECVMIGNNVLEDIVAAEKAGLSVFLINNKCLINSKNIDYSEYPQGDISDAMDYIEELTKKLKR